MLVLLTLLTGVTAFTNQIDVPASAFTTFDLPTPISGPCDVSLGPDSLLYVQEFFTDKIARFNQSSGEWKEYDIPFTLGNTTIPLPSYLKFELLACAIRTGYDGAMYFSNGAHNQLVRHNVTSGETVVFDPVGSNLEPFNDVTTAPDGVYFSQTTGNVITRFDYFTHEFTNFEVPTPGATPLGMYYTDGGVWVLEFTANRIARFDVEAQTFEEYDLDGCVQPLVVRAATDEMLWFACTTSSSIGGINVKTREVVNFPEPNAPTETVEVGQDQKGNVWATHILQNSLGVLNPRTGNVSVVVEPDALQGPGITVPFYGETGIIGYAVGQPPGQGDPAAAGNAIWYTHFGSNQLVRLDLDGVVVP